MQRFNPYDPAVLADPYPHYQRLRAEDPVHWGIAGDPQLAGTWYLLRHDDAQATLKDPRFGREVHKVLPPETLPPIPEAYRPLFTMAQQWMILRDPPDHTRLRALVNKAFTPRMIEAVRPRIARIADALLDRVQGDTMDLIADYASPLPVIVIAELVGVPPEDRELFLPWSIDLARAIDMRQTEEVYQRGSDAVLSMSAYLHDVIAARRRAPQDDLISALLAAEEQGERLTPEMVLGTVIMLLFAGYEPTMHLIGNSVLALLRHPDQLALLQDNPTLMSAAVDELLRYDSSVQMTFRYALEDVELSGKTIRTGEHVAIVFGAALRDPAHYPDPDRLDLTRARGKDITFGLGPHYCLGAALARAEGEIGISALLRRQPTLAQKDSAIAWQETAAVRGLKSLPIRVV